MPLCVRQKGAPHVSPSVRGAQGLAKEKARTDARISGLSEQASGQAFVDTERPFVLDHLDQSPERVRRPGRRLTGCERERFQLELLPDFDPARAFLAVSVHLATTVSKEQLHGGELATEVHSVKEGARRLTDLPGSSRAPPTGPSPTAPSQLAIPLQHRESSVSGVPGASRRNVDGVPFPPLFLPYSPRSAGSPNSTTITRNPTQTLEQKGGGWGAHHVGHSGEGNLTPEHTGFARSCVDHGRDRDRLVRRKLAQVERQRFSRRVQRRRSERIWVGRHAALSLYVDVGRASAGQDGE